MSVERRWNTGELERVGDAEELEISSRRNDGSLRGPRTIWVVRLQDRLFVRSVNGPGSAWYRGVEVQRRGHISAGGVDCDVGLPAADHGLDDAIDAEYRAKYASYSEDTLDRITSRDARSTTIELVPEAD